MNELQFYSIGSFKHIVDRDYVLLNTLLIEIMIRIHIVCLWCTCLVNNGNQEELNMCLYIEASVLVRSNAVSRVIKLFWFESGRMKQRKEGK